MNHTLIILIGLPAAGKTTYAQQKYPDHLLFDDFIQNFCNNKLLNNIKQNICINDPRMCIPSVFKQYMDIFLEYIDKQHILLVLFDKNVEQSMNNAKLRGDVSTSKTIERIQNSIVSISEYYDVTNYSDYDNIVVDTWSSS